MDISVLTLSKEASAGVLRAQDILFRSLRNLSLQFEVLYCDETGTQEGQDFCVELKSRYTHLKVLAHPKPLGRDRCLLDMLKQSQGKVIFYWDVNSPIDFNDFPVFLDKTRQADVVVSSWYASKDIQHADPWARFFSFFCQKILRVPVCQVSSHAIVLRRKIVDQVLSEMKGQQFFLEFFSLAQKKGASFQEAPLLLSVKRNSKFCDLWDVLRFRLKK